MADSGFNGTTFLWGAADQTPLVSLSFDSTVAEVDVTGAADTEHTFEPGIINESITWEVIGATSLVVGDEAGGPGTTAAWNSAGAGDWGTFTNAVITSVSKGGGLGGAVTTSITAKPTAA